MSRNTLYLFIALLAAAASVAAYLFYQEQQKTDSIQIKVGEGSITIETK